MANLSKWLHESLDDFTFIFCRELKRVTRIAIHRLAIKVAYTSFVIFNPTHDGFFELLEGGQLVLSIDIEITGFYQQKGGNWMVL